MNCLLDLGFKIEQNYAQSMWVPGSKPNSHTLAENHKSLLAYLPALHTRKEFEFNSNLVFSWSHDWPYQYSEFNFEKVFLFVRDPRDSLYSHYRRINVSVSFEKYLSDSIEYPLYLDSVETWNWFHRIWLTYPQIKVIKYEDCKISGVSVVSSLLQSLDINLQKAEIQNAIESSSFKNAFKAQEKYKEMDVAGKSPFNLINSGVANEWSQDANRENMSEMITLRTYVELLKLGYPIRPLHNDTNVFPNDLAVTTESLTNLGLGEIVRQIILSSSRPKYNILIHDIFQLIKKSQFNQAIQLVKHGATMTSSAERISHAILSYVFRVFKVSSYLMRFWKRKCYSIVFFLTLKIKKTTVLIRTKSRSNFETFRKAFRLLMTQLLTSWPQTRDRSDK